MSEQLIKKTRNLRTHCQHAETHCHALPHTATHCNTLQHTATHYTALQLAATHYNTLQNSASNRPSTTNIFNSLFLSLSLTLNTFSRGLSLTLSLGYFSLSHPLSKRAATRRYSWKSYDKLEKKSQQKEKLIQTPNAPSTHCNTLQHNARRSLDVLGKMSQKKKALTQTPHALPNADILADY